MGEHRKRSMFVLNHEEKLFAPRFENGKYVVAEIMKMSTIHLYWDVPGGPYPIMYRVYDIERKDTFYTTSGLIHSSRDMVACDILSLNEKNGFWAEKMGRIEEERTGEMRRVIGMALLPGSKAQEALCNEDLLMIMAHL